MWKAICLCCAVASTLAAAEMRQFEAENVVVEREKLNRDKVSSTAWDVWTTDPAGKRWSEGTVLRIGGPKSDRKPEDPASALLTLRLPLEDGVYRISAAGGRTFGISADGGRSFARIDARGVVADRVEVRGGVLELKLANCYAEADPANHGLVYVDRITAERLADLPKSVGTVVLKPGAARRLEAEEFVVEQEKLTRNKISSSVWDVWNEDRKGAWSGDQVLRIAGPRADREPGDPASAVLTLRIPVENGSYRISANGGRSFAVSIDGRTFRRISGHGVVAERFDVKNGSLELKVANCCAEKDPAKYGAVYLDCITLERLGGTAAPVETPKPPPPVKYPDPGVSWLKNDGSSRKFEAEDCVVNRELLTVDVPQKGRWELWSKDENASRWSGRKVLRTFAVEEDRSPDAPESAMLKFRIPVEKGEKYTVYCQGGRSYGVSRDGKQFRKVVENGVLFEKVSSDTGYLEFYIANCFRHDLGPGSVYLDHFQVTRCRELPALPRVEGWAEERVRENLNRGVVAIPAEEEKAYISWRLLKEDPADIGFDVFRIRGGREVKLNQAPVVQTCDFIAAGAKEGDRYAVRPADGFTGKAGESALLKENYISFKLPDPKMSVMRAGIGDLNGDGTYDCIFKTPDANIDPWEAYWYPTPEPYKLEAYLADGTHLWTRSCGWAIERGVWYSPFIVYDFNGDGRAEVALKMGEGDPRDKDGRVFTGPEYLVILDGMTGEEIARAPWPSRDGFENYNHVNRNQLAMAYLDGKTPCVVALRGTYGMMKAEAWQLKDGKLENVWKFDNEGLDAKYRGQGCHATIVADLDGDGRDEILLGNMALDDNGEILWSTGRGHNDRMYLSDIMPENPGLEIAYGNETPGMKDGLCLVDAKTGKVLWGINEQTWDVNNAYAIDLDPTIPGIEVMGHDFAGRGPSKERRWLFSGSGKLLKRGAEAGVMRYGIYWDADLEKEECSGLIRDFNGGPVGGIFAGNLIATADLFGDWREEVIVSMPGEVRIYTTAIPAMDRRPALMQEPSYRTAVLNNSQGYTQEPCLPYLPTRESDNFSLISRTGNDSCLQVTVSASRHGALAGKVRLSAPAGVTLEPAEWDVSLKAGEVSVTRVRVSGEVKNGLPVRGELIERGGKKRILRGQVPLYREKVRAIVPGTVTVPAPEFSSEKGGSVKIEMGRPLAKDGCMLGWDDKGHTVSWNFRVPSAGRYRLAMLRASARLAERRLTVAGKDCGTFLLSPTGGFGNSPEEWVLEGFERGGKELVFDLPAGEVTVSMENTNAGSMNLAYLYLEPVK
ncbi:MAG: hypothetical protein HPZ91_08235 [Lentisphaeria bacterium]|nr:hypothetical protein [Lentisphaeria bacterium]